MTAPSPAAPAERRDALVWRPVQYLGSKQRALPAIRSAVDELTGGAPADVADAFSGSGVVTQALALRGYRMRSVDASPAAAVLARAATGAGRRGGLSVGDLLERARADFAVRAQPWSAHLAAEADALGRGDAPGLVTAEAAFPQVWRDADLTCEATVVPLAQWHASVEGTGLYPSSFLSAVFAGTYLSLRQSLMLEAFLATAYAAHQAGEVDSWGLDAVRTLAMHAASAASFSAGKHFAQPHLLSGGKPLEFHHRRLLRDRAVDVERRILDAAGPLEAVASAVTHPARVHCTPVEEAAAAWAGAAVVYADPPYTAQQYSRFYHVLDLIACGVPRPLQAGAREGTSTRGLYPTGRFLSAYCRIATAADALRGLVHDVHAAGAHLVLSYSVSAPGGTGNARMIPLDTVTGIVAAVYGVANTRCRRIPLTYRSFNRTSVAGADDREVLVVARAA